VWAPHAQHVSVIGSFNDWDGNKHPMHAETNGSWYAAVAEAQVGDQYRFNSDWQGYSEDFAGHPSTNVITELGEYDGCPCHAALAIAPYSVLIFSQ
jgi:predicted carbohydrate-binding protein with CBM48